MVFNDLQVGTSLAESSVQHSMDETLVNPGHRTALVVKLRKQGGFWQNVRKEVSVCNDFSFSFKQTEEKSHIQIHGELTPEKAYDIYSFLDHSLSSQCQDLSFDLKNIGRYTALGIFLLSSVIRELKKTIQSIEISGIPSEQESNFKSSGILDLPRVSTHPV